MFKICNTQISQLWYIHVFWLGYFAESACRFSIMEPVFHYRKYVFNNVCQIWREMQDIQMLSQVT